jgi:ubiquinone/menaquinone biosynthesis C-methylase UbiE
VPRFTTDQIGRYYDCNTPAFVALGQGRRSGFIHRAVWGPGVRSRRDAFHYVEDQLVERMRHSAAGDGRHIVDLGCGVGASLCYLAERLPAVRGTGITLSTVQARLAQARIQTAGLADRVVCVEGDYCQLPASIGPADLAYAIESFVHGPSPERFFAECSRLIRSGGTLVICDDFLRTTDDRGALQVLDSFRRGWHINTLLHPAELRETARAAGFELESTIDLSPYLELRRPRDRAIQAWLALRCLVGLDGSSAGHLLGGNALQTCLERRWLAYDLVIFRRT